MTAKQPNTTETPAAQPTPVFHYYGVTVQTDEAIATMRVRARDYKRAERKASMLLKRRLRNYRRKLWDWVASDKQGSEPKPRGFTWRGC